ncbi:MAG: nitrous oxide reductase accessory protein NosL [Bacteroidia bacterium]
MLKYLIPLTVVVFLSCTSEPKKIKIGSDQCHFCKMTIMEENFACQTITKKGKVYVYDDLKCQIKEKRSQEKSLSGAQFFVSNYLDDGAFLNFEQAFFIESSEFKSPMAGNIAAVATQSEAEVLASEKNGAIINIENAFE